MARNVGQGTLPASAQSPSRRKKQSSQVTCERLFAISREVAPRRPARILAREIPADNPLARRIRRKLRVFSGLQKRLENQHFGGFVANTRNAC